MPWLGPLYPESQQQNVFTSLSDEDLLPVSLQGPMITLVHPDDFPIPRSLTESHVQRPLLLYKVTHSQALGIGTRTPFEGTDLAPVYHPDTFMAVAFGG